MRDRTSGEESGVEDPPADDEEKRLDVGVEGSDTLMISSRSKRRGVDGAVKEPEPLNVSLPTRISRPGILITSVGSKYCDTDREYLLSLG